MPYKRSGTSNWGIVVRGVRKSSGTASFEAAAALEREQNAQPESGEVITKKVGAHSWPELCEAWERERKHKKSWADDERKIAWLHDHLGAIEDISLITRPLIDKIMQDDRGANPEVPSPSNSTTNRYVALISAMINYASRAGANKHGVLGWLEFPQAFRRYPEPEGRDVWLTVEQWQALHGQLARHYLAPATFAISTGLRAEKVFGLEWSQIDFTRRTMTFTGTANKKGNTIPLNSVGMGVLLKCRAQTVVHKRYVFTYVSQGAEARFGDKGAVLTPQRVTRPGRSFYKAMKRAGLGDWVADETGALHWEGFVWHGFRHTFATWLRDTDAPDWALDALCGWVQSKGGGEGQRFERNATRNRYAHGLADKAREYSERVAELMQGKRALTQQQA